MSTRLNVEELIVEAVPEGDIRDEILTALDELIEALTVTDEDATEEYDDKEWAQGCGYD